MKFIISIYIFIAPVLLIDVMLVKKHYVLFVFFSLHNVLAILLNYILLLKKIIIILFKQIKLFG